MSVQVIDALQDPQWTDGQVQQIAANLRASDRDEIAASSGLEPLFCLRESVTLSSRAWIVLDRLKRPIVAFGVAPSIHAGIGVAWLLGTNGMMGEAINLARHTQTYLDQMHADFPQLFNFVDARNDVSLRWLEWSGFRIVSSRPAHGPEQRLFYEMARLIDWNTTNV